MNSTDKMKTSIDDLANQKIQDRKPEWLKVQIRIGENYSDLKRIVQRSNLHTVCQEALCPNIYECWERRSATLMILGDVCTRSCRFCSVQTGSPTKYDSDEPLRIAEAVRKMGLKYCVITSVTRDDLTDGGASIWAETVRQIRRMNQGCSVEVLIPDFNGNDEVLQTVFETQPKIMDHNVETVPRLYRTVRPQADYQRSLTILNKSVKFGLITKSALMVGLGESTNEVLEVMRDVGETGCHIFSVGQYLQPTKAHLPVDRFVHPDEFQMYRDEGLKIGFKWVESAPLVRSSYHADKHVVSKSLN